MPPLPALLGGAMKVPIVVSFDGTGFGNLSFNTAVIRNPYMGAAAQQLRPIGLSRGSDDKKGTEAVFGPNLPRLHQLFRLQEKEIASERLLSLCLDGRQCHVEFDLMVCTDVGALRHCERMLNSGWCCCDRDFALRTIPTKPSDIDEMHALLKKCHSPTFIERCVCGAICVFQARMYHAHALLQDAILPMIQAMLLSNWSCSWRLKKALKPIKQRRENLGFPVGDRNTLVGTSTCNQEDTATRCCSITWTTSCWIGCISQSLALQRRRGSMVC